jgi:PAS domain S-box-containing protein
MDRLTLVRMVGIFVGFPILVALSRYVLLTLGLRGDSVWVVSIAVCGAVFGAAAFYLSRREHQMLLEEQRIGSQRAAAEARYRLLADNAVDVIAHLRGNEVVWISPSVEPAFGWPVEHWVGTDVSLRMHPDDLDTVTAALRKVIRGESALARHRIATSDGGYHWVDGRGKAFVDADGKVDGVIVAVRVVDEQVRFEQQLKAEKHRFEDIVRNSSSAISVRDLQHRYTSVNDAFCEMFGQKSVSDVIGRTEAEILPPDVLERSRSAQLGLMAGVGSVEDESIQLGAETISVVTQRFPLHDFAGEVTGLATIRTDITHRKKALQAIADRDSWRDLVASAIADKRLLAYAQPIIDIATREIVAQELLVRLSVAQTAEITTPEHFLPQCERYHLMPVIDRYMIGQAIGLARGGMQVSVNIAGQTIGDDAAMSEITQMLTAAGTDVRSKVIFEITETTAVASPAMAKAFSTGMRRLGCRVALDDFGTGYGTFTELRYLALYSLKIDQIFVKNMLEDLEDERVVKTIISVARNYGLTTIAEGVESEAVLERLAELGVDRAQGYLFGKPRPVVW